MSDRNRGGVPDENALRGARVLITRPEEDGAALAASVRELGGEAWTVPLIRIEGPEDPAPLEEARRNFAAAEWVALTSRHAARALLEGLPAAEGGPKIAVVGASTAAAAEALGHAPHLVAEGRGAKALAAAMIDGGAAGRTVLYPHSNLAAEDLRRLLEAAGCGVRSFEAYRTLPPGGPERETLRPLLEAGNGAVFASPSAVHAFAGIARGEKSALFDEWIAVAIGRTTGTALREAGFARTREAKEPNDDGLLEALTEAWRARAGERRNRS